jgi:hypothetical protein
MLRQPRMAAIMAACLITYGLVVQAFHWMNLASDRAFYGGSAIILGLILFVPVIVRTLWRKL